MTSCMGQAQMRYSIDFTFYRASNLTLEKHTRVARSKKTAPMPEHEKGSAIEGMRASGGGLSLPTTGNQGKGPLK